MSQPSSGASPAPAPIDDCSVWNIQDVSSGTGKPMPHDTISPPKSSGSETSGTNRADSRDIGDPAVIPLSLHPMQQATSATMSMPFAIGPHFHECCTSLRRWHFRKNHQLAHTEGFDERWCSQIGEVFLSVIRQMQQTEHLRHPCFAKSFLLADLGLRQLLFVRQPLLPAEHPANGMTHGGTFVHFVAGLDTTRATRFPSELEWCSDERGEIVLRQRKPQNQPDPEAGS